MNYLEYFMWGYQTHFYISVKHAAEEIFKRLDKKLTPNVFLVGILQEGIENKHVACVEPEDCIYRPLIFQNTMKLSKEFERNDPAQELFYSHPISQQRHVQQLKIKSIKDTVHYLLKDSDNEKTHYISSPVLINDYWVMVVLEFDKQTISLYYSLGDSTKTSQFELSTSLVEATIDEYLSECSKALSLPDPGSSLGIINRYEDILRASGERLMYTPAAAGNSREGLHGLFESINIISSLKYEGQDGNGKIIIAEKGHQYIEILLELTKPVSIKNYRAVRKLLEISSDSVCLLSDAWQIYGLGRVSDKYDTSHENLFIVTITSHYEWRLLHESHTLMEVRYGLPVLPAPLLEDNIFSDHCSRIFIGITQEQIQNLWSLTKEAAKQKYGTMLVITDGAVKESERLANQCTTINPIPVSTEIMNLITNIDGSVLIDRLGICYAIGVILDGIATSKGDPARGSRFNSAVRYLETTHFPCLIITFSEDGMINLVPTLRPRIERRIIDEKLKELYEMSDSHTKVNWKLFNHTMEWFRKNEFYLSKKVCDEINSLKNRIDSKHDLTSIKIVHRDLSPNSEMNESYFY